MEKVAGRVGLAIALLVALVGYLLLAYWLLTPYIEPYAAYWRGETSPIPNGWAALTPYYAWPVLVAYGGALVLAVICIAVQAGRLTVRRQRRDADKRHDDAMQEARRRTEDAKQIRQQGEAMQQEARGGDGGGSETRKGSRRAGRKGRVQARAFGRYQHWSPSANPEAEKTTGIGYDWPIAEKLKTPHQFQFGIEFCGVSIPKKGRVPSTNPELAVLPENRGAASPRIHAGVFYRAGLQRDRANRETHDAKTTTAPRSCAALPSARVGVQPTPAFGVASSNAGKAAGVQPQPLAHATRRRRQYDAKRSEHRVLTTPGLPRYLRPMRLFLCTTAEQRGYPGPQSGCF